MTYPIILAAAFVLPATAYLLVYWAVRELDPNARTPEQARREAMERRSGGSAGQPVHDDSRETANV